MNSSDPIVDVTGKLKFTGEYVFVVHYYQPKYPGNISNLTSAMIKITYLAITHS